jgi:hypothetical protein
MELLLTQPDIDDSENKTITPSYSHKGPFISFRQFRQQYFQPNPTVKSFELIQTNFFFCLIDNSIIRRNGF